MTIDRSRLDALDDEPSPVEQPSIDWSRLTEGPTLDRSDATDPLDDSVPRRLDPPAPLLEAGDALQPGRVDVTVSRLHPDRLVPASATEQAELRRAWELDPDPAAWVAKVNPGFVADARAGRVGRTENCADAARAFQATLDGNPSTAAAIDRRGLPCREQEGTSGGGEDITYTEQWAGTRAEQAGYDDIRRRVSADHGSAIILGQGHRGGHAFNAYWDTGRGRVRWADAQSGIVGDWPPAELRHHFPVTRAIFFTPGRAR